MAILFAEENKIELHNIALVPKYNSNLILLGKLQEIGIIYPDHLDGMVLIRKKEVIIQAKRD